VHGGLQTGIKLAGGFTIAGGRTTMLILEFDAAQSLERTGSAGGYQLRPVIKVMPAGLQTAEGGQTLAQNGSF
jgi:hypothetical protein